MGDQEWALCCSMVCLFEFLTPSTLGGINFFNPNPFLTIFSVPNAPIGRVQVLFGHQKQQSPPLASGLPWTQYFEFWCSYSLHSHKVSRMLQWLFSLNFLVRNTFQTRFGVFVCGYNFLRYFRWYSIWYCC